MSRYALAVLLALAMFAAPSARADTDPDAVIAAAMTPDEAAKFRDMTGEAGDAFREQMRQKYAFQYVKNISSNPIARAVDSVGDSVIDALKGVWNAVYSVWLAIKALYDFFANLVNGQLDGEMFLTTSLAIYLWVYAFVVSWFPASIASTGEIALTWVASDGWIRQSLGFVAWWMDAFVNMQFVYLISGLAIAFYPVWICVRLIIFLKSHLPTFGGGGK